MSDLRGDAGDNTLRVVPPTTMQPGDIIDGGAGYDLLAVGSYVGGIDLSKVEIRNVEEFYANHASVTLSSSQVSIFQSIIGSTLNIADSGYANLTGTGGLDYIYLPNSGGNLDFSHFLYGFKPSFYVYGGSGDDRVTAGAVDDYIITNGGNDLVYGGSGDDYLSGAAADDTLFGGVGADRLEGGAGRDVIRGGDGDDQFLLSDTSDATQGEIYDGGSGYDTITIKENSENDFADFSHSQLVGIERITGDGVMLTTSQIAQLLQIDSDVHVANGGVVQLTQAKQSTLYLSDYGNKIDLTSLLSMGIYGGLGNDTVIGSSFGDTLFGGGGNDLFVSGAGDDWLDGGAGVDTVSYATATSAITADLGTISATGAGHDMLLGIENIIGSAFNDVLTGDGGANTLTGGNGNDTLSGGYGDDILDGGSGIDTVIYSDAAAGIVLNLVSTTYQNTGGSGIDIVRNVENVIGSAFGDTLTGNAFANILTGGDGNDVLNGGLGNDTLFGGDGIDTASYANAAGAIRANLTIVTAQSTISAGSDILSGIENLIGGAYDDQLTGDAGNNVLTGNAGNDLLVGGLGDDMLYGGAGIDTASYANATSGVTISLALTTAQDTHGAGIDTFVSIENITGSAYDDVITGSAQVNVINGGTGNDTIDAGSSNDTVDGGYGNDILKGAAGDDVLIGNIGADTLTGASGADTLTGGAQNDRFVYAALTDSTLATSDRITDFAKGDILDLSAIDASSKVAGNQAFVHAAAFSHTAGEFTLAFDAGTNTTTALFDTDGDATANMAILFTGNVTALTSTWVL